MDYRNRLTSSTDGIDTSSYEYDSNNQRIKLVEGADTTIYPTLDYEIKNGSVKVSLNLDDSLVASDDNGTINHVHTDHLGGTNITTDTLGVITQTLDYFPFGDTRIDTGTDTETRQFTGYIKDYATDLSYAGARYFKSDIGRFISQDPANLRLGINAKELKQLLGDPQQLNTYSYARNNPIYFKDPDGEILPAIILGVAVGSAYFLSDVHYAGDNAPTQTTEIIDKAVYNNVIGSDYDSLSLGEQAGLGLLIGVGSLNPKKVVKDLIGVGKTGFTLSKNAFKKSNLKENSLNLTNHAIERLGQRKINIADLQKTINSPTDVFKYSHNGDIKTGLFNQKDGIFVGVSKEGNITTVINNAKEKYVNNLKKTLSKKKTSNK